MAVEDQTVSLILAEAGTERRRRTDLNLIGGPSVTDRPALGRLDLDFFGTVRVGVVELDVVGTDYAQAMPINLDVGDVPEGAFVLGAHVRLEESFAAGTGTYIRLAIGTTVDVDAIVTAADLLAAPVDFCVSAYTEGIAPNRRFASGGTVTATIQSDLTYPGSGATFTAGRCTIRVLYVVPS